MNSSAITVNVSNMDVLFNDGITNTDGFIQTDTMQWTYAFTSVFIGKATKEQLVINFNTFGFARVSYIVYKV